MLSELWTKSGEFRPQMKMIDLINCPHRRKLHVIDRSSTTLTVNLTFDKFSELFSMEYSVMHLLKVKNKKIKTSTFDNNFLNKQYSERYLNKRILAMEHAFRQ